MENLNNYIQGNCMEMCPKEEIEMREKEKMLHLLEMVPGTEKYEFPKADQNRAVKCYSRSAAGKKINKDDYLRPPKVLLKTVSYLLFDVISSKKLPWYAVYNFITDRLMSIRQDMIVQNIPTAESITILQPIVRFHAYAAYRLCNASLNNFDPVLNNNHLQESLKRLLHFYDAYSDLLQNKCLCLETSTCNDYLIECRPEFEALYIIFNLGNEEALRRSLTIPEKYRTQVVNDAVKLSDSCRYGNFVRMCRIIKKLPMLLAATAALQLPEIRRKAFAVMSTAYNSKNLYFLVTTLKEILLYSSDKELLQDCKYYGIKADNECIYFMKQSFDTTRNAITPRYEAFIEDKLMEENVQSVILGL